MDQDITIGTKLFELYMMLQKFGVLGSDLIASDINYACPKYHTWFTAVVMHWVDISEYKAIKRIDKAIKLDELVPVTDVVVTLK